jgi:hypothetical protein
VLTKEIEAWRLFIEKIPINEDKVVLTKLLESCYKYSVAINNHAETHPFPSESLIMALLLTQYILINQIKLMMRSASKRHDN